MSETNKVKDTIEAVTGLVEAVPVYEDLAQPAAKELGKTLLTGAKLINMTLAPVSGLVWGYEKIKEYLIPKLEEKLEKVPPENIVTPDPTIAVPSIEAMRYTSHKEELREMYVNLLANSMNNETSDSSHPAFVEIIKQLASDEALIFKYFDSEENFPIIRIDGDINEGKSFLTTLNNFSTIPYEVNCSNPKLASQYLDNLVRLGLLSISYNASLTNKVLYTPLEEHQLVQEYVQRTKAQGRTPRFTHGYITRTNFGSLFYDMCILD